MRTNFEVEQDVKVFHKSGYKNGWIREIHEDGCIVVMEDKYTSEIIKLPFSLIKPLEN